MLITRFNQLIRSRIVWAAVGVIVSLSFVGVSVSRSGCDRTTSTRGIEGWLYGKPVKTPEFLMARYFELRSLGETKSLSEDEAKELRRRTWRRLATLREAERMGLTVTPTELRQIISRDPTFVVNGTFSPERYRAFVLNQMRMDISTFEEYLRQEATIRELISTFGMLSLTAPEELERRMSALTDRLSVEYVTVRDESVEAPPVSEEEARSFFERNREMFRIPDQVAVKYVVFPISNHVASAEVSEEEVSDYYHEHIAQYSTRDTNDTPVARPLAEVREEIEKVLRWKAATLLARDRATEFSLELLPDTRRGRKARSFEEAASANGLNVWTTGFFTAESELPEVEAPAAFAEAAFKLDPHDPEGYFSDPIIGTNNVYVLAVVEKKEARDPAFEEVRARAMELAARDAHERALRAAAEMTRSNLLAKIAQGSSFADAARDLGLNVQTTGTFVAYLGPPTNMPNGELVAEAVGPLDTGEISEPLLSKDGAILAYMARRQPGEPGAVEMLRPQFQRTFDSMNAVFLFREWQEQLLARAGLRDVREDPSLAARTSASGAGEGTAPVDLDLQ